MFYNMLRRVSFVGKKKEFDKKSNSKRDVFSIVFDGHMQSTMTLP